MLLTTNQLESRIELGRVFRGVCDDIAYNRAGGKIGVELKPYNNGNTLLVVYKRGNEYNPIIALQSTNKSRFMYSPYHGIVDHKQALEYIRKNY